MATMIPGDVEEFGTETEFVGLLGLIELLGFIGFTDLEARSSLLA